MGDDERYYRLFLIWLRDPDLFDRYQREVAPIARRYGDVERSLTPQQIQGEGLRMPDIANIAFFHTEAALRDQNDDPAFRSVVRMRSASVDLASVTGTAEGGTVTETGLADRCYLVEIARFGEAGEAGYRAYEREAEAFMAPYGYHVERVIRTSDDSDGLPFRPDLVKVAYFDDAAAMERMHNDPDHTQFEGERYSSVVAESLWLVAQARVVTPADRRG